MFKRLFAFATVAWMAWQWDRRRRERGALLAQQQRSKAKPAAVATWEGEGGALPVSGARTGPAPTVS